MGTKVLMSRRVQKWRNTADNKTLDLFEKQITKLLAGDRSRTLRKRLGMGMGKSSPKIFEAYVQQHHGGHRVLYSEARHDHAMTIMVHDVVHHDGVKASLRLINSKGI